MASLGNTLPAFPVALGPSDAGAISYVVGAGRVYVLESLAFQVDLSASAAADDIWVEVRDQPGALICGQVVLAAMAAGDIAAFTLAPHLNPCDNIRVSASIGLYPDTFPALTLVEGCTLSIQALDSAAAGADTDAVISEAVMWVTSAGGGETLSGEPLFVPIPLNEQAA